MKSLPQHTGQGRSFSSHGIWQQFGGSGYQATGKIIQEIHRWVY